MTDPVEARDPRDATRRQLLLLLLGVGAIVLATVAGGAEAAGRILEPPFPVGWLLGSAAAILGVVALLRGLARIRPARDDARELIRAVRLLFVAVGCFAAAGGWIFGSPLPIIAGLVIIGIDVVETTFLLLLTAARAPGEGEGPMPGSPPVALPEVLSPSAAPSLASSPSAAVSEPPREPLE